MQIIKEVDILSLYLGDIVIYRVNDVALVRFKQITKKFLIKIVSSICLYYMYVISVIKFSVQLIICKPLYQLYPTIVCVSW